MNNKSLLKQDMYVKSFHRYLPNHDSVPTVSFLNVLTIKIN